ETVVEKAAQSLESSVTNGDEEAIEDKEEEAIELQH
ncbi:hypothetical protein Tco_1260288, partial [Tanacetum coccineum]